MTHRKNPAAVSLGRLGGSAKSAAKTDAARANGKRGGRPRKDAATTVSKPVTMRIPVRRRADGSWEATGEPYGVPTPPTK